MQESQKECTGENVRIAHNVSYENDEGKLSTYDRLKEGFFDKNHISPSEFKRTYAPLTEETHPRYHKTLRLLGQDKLSWKIERCGIDALKVYCSENAQHSYYVPIFCNRRTCPECSLQDMYRRFLQFEDIAAITRKANEFPGSHFPRSWRVRMWTLTSLAIKNQPLDKPIEACKKALHRVWRYTYGNQTPRDSPRGLYGPEPDAGGLFMLEIQGGWNVHFHGLVFGPYRYADYVRELWSESLDMFGWYGRHVHIEQAYKGKSGDYSDSIMEVLQYPVKPNKEGRHDEELLANVEAALSGKRRFFLKGSWYNHFPKEKIPGDCPICHSDVYLEFDKDFQRLLGSTFEKRFFDWTDEGLSNFGNFTKTGFAKNFFSQQTKGRDNGND